MCYVQMASALMEGYTQKQAYNSAASVANQNATMAENASNQVQVQKQQQLYDINAKKRQTIGAQRAAMAASGTDTSMGTGLGAITSTAESAQQDKNRTEYNASLESQNYLNQAIGYRNEASYYKSAGKNAMTMGIIGAGASALGSLGTTADSDTTSQLWKKPKQWTNSWQSGLL